MILNDQTDGANIWTEKLILSQSSEPYLNSINMILNVLMIKTNYV